jgi:hypothetical protein
MLKHQTDRWLRQNKLILLVDDIALKQIVNYRLDRKFDLIESHIRQMVRAVQYGNDRRA